jgi:class 3 adenylate cyclase
MQEVASVIISYGGYVLKYIGDAVLGFLIVPPEHRFEENKVETVIDNTGHINHITNENDNFNSSYIPCMNAITCGRSIIRILDQAINPILNQYGYPEMSVRIGIDIGENVVIQDGWDIHRLPQSKSQGMKQTIIIREPHFDIIGYGTKMTKLANPNGIVIGQSVYDTLDYEKSSFKLLDVNPDVWKYIDDRTDAIYRVYHNS